MGIGIGGGIGPIRVGTHVSDDELASCLGLILAIALAAMAIFWPFLLGEWVATKLGADDGSTLALATGWTFEAAYVLGAIAIWSSRRRSARAAKQEAMRAAAVHSREVVRQVCARLASNPGGSADRRVSGNERLLFILSGVSLVEPRVAQRGGPRVPTLVANGDALVSDKAIHFRSVDRQVTWLLAKIHTQYEGSDSLTWGVTNRQSVTGVGGSKLIRDVLEGLVLWAEQLPSDPTEAESYFSELQQEMDSRLEASQ